MGRFTPYNLTLKSLTEGIHAYEYQLDNKFFDAIDDDQVHKGKVSVTVHVKRTLQSFELTFAMNGSVQLPCDRCLDDMTLPVEVNEVLYVKFGQEFGEEGDNLIIVPEAEGELNIAWFLFEFIALSIPIKHVHPPGQCNKEMSSKLRKHSTRKVEDDDFEDTDEFDSGTEDESSTDPRWDGLKQLLDN
ncbi:MAG: YceD family protein [Bacteroidales bacterium]